MPLNPLNHHYAMENPASVYDEEAMTALELAGRTTAKVNETVKAFNKLETETNEHLETQDQTIESRLTTQDNRITKMNDETMPAKVVSEFQKNLNNGTFEGMVDTYAGNLEARVDNLLSNVPAGGTSRDAEVIDIRTDYTGKVHENAGNAIRKVTAPAMRKALKAIWHLPIFSSTVTNEYGNTNHLVLSTDGSGGKMGFALDFIGNGEKLKAGKVYTLIVDAPCDFIPHILETVSHTYGDNVETTFSRKAGNTFTFIPNEDFGAISVELSQNGESMEIYASLIEDDVDPMVYPAQLTENAKGFSEYLTDHYWYGVDSTVTYNNDRAGGLCVHDVTLTPGSGGANAGINSAIDLEENQPYRLVIKGLENTNTVKLHYGTLASWGTGSFATKMQNITRNEDTGDYFIDFMVTDNSVGAKNLLLQVGGLTKALNLKIGLMTLCDKEAINKTTTTEYLAFCGDSLTQQMWYSYVNTSKTKIGFGVGGENIQAIFERTGVEPLYVESTTIKPGKNQILLSNSGLFGQGMGNINPVTIAGIGGTLSRENDLYYFTPTNDIVETPVYRPLVIPYQAKLNIIMYVFWVGTNNLNEWSTNQYIFNSWKKVLDMYPNSIIVGLHNDSTTDKLTRVRELDEMGKSLGNRFVPVHDWLVEHGLAYCGLTPTSADTVAINAGKVPPALLSDTVHLNENGKKCISYLVSERLKIFNAL